MSQGILKFLFFFLLTIFPLGQLVGVSLTNGVVLHPLDLGVGATVVIWLFRTKKKVKPPFALALLSFLSLLFFSLLLRIGEVDIPSFVIAILYLVRFAFYIGFYFAVYDLVFSGIIKELEIVRSFTLVGAVSAVLGLAQYIFLPDTRFLGQYGWDVHYFRLVGTFLDPGFSGLIFVLFILLVSSYKLGRGELRLPLFLLGFAAMMLTYSRASYIAFLAGWTVWFIVRRNLRVFLVGILSFAFSVLFLPRPGGEGVNLTRSSTVVYRVNNYQLSLNIGLTRPLFGVGFNLFKPEAERLSGQPLGEHAGAGSDSSLLFVFATTGIAGFLSFLFFLWQVFSVSWRNKNKASGLVLLSSFTAVFLHSFFNNSLFYSWVAFWLFTILAMQSRASKENR